MDPLRVLIVADDPLVRAGLAVLLDNQPECTVAGQLASAGDLAAEAAIYHPDALLWDLGWDSAPEALPEPADDLNDLQLRVVVLLPDNSLASRAWALGARGLLYRNADADILVAALQAVAQGLSVLDPALAASILPPADGAAPGLVEELTAREMDVLQLLAEGLSNKAIAQGLDISEHTVKFHVNSILGKLGAQSRTDAVVRAMRLGLIIL